ncbi:unnamed protein product [Protopolystoma xenopodis]|uniref:MUN domain-containing protein n=1 Tax=Protopolystoma xenopodis TaxID=117903 RepID=A0A3S5AGC7_9PLAT|nr:unnamed protein product [Protopolystoma xenopodis]
MGPETVSSEEARADRPNGTSDLVDPVTGVRSLTYWHKLITLIVSVIEDDSKHYASVLNQYVSVSLSLFLFL